MFEIVYICTHWYDGPRKGIADYQGHPHVFLSDWGEPDGDLDTFWLSPIDPETLQLALEQSALWRRWETAFHQGQTGHDSHPALLEERARYEELERLLKGRLEIDRQHALYKTAVFRKRQDPSWSGLGWSPLEVRWLEPVIVEGAPKISFLYENNGTGEKDLTLHFAGQVWVGDTYHLDESLRRPEGKDSTQTVLRMLLDHWLSAVEHLPDGGTIFLPHNFADEYPGWLRCIRSGETVSIRQGNADLDEFSFSPSDLEKYRTLVPGFWPNTPAIQIDRAELIRAIRSTWEQT